MPAPHLPVRILPAVGLALLAAACNDVEPLPGGGSSTSASGGGADAADVPAAAAAAGAVATMIQASVESVIARGTDDNVTTTTRGFDTRALTRGEAVVDLDQRRLSADKFPNATGKFTLTTSAEVFASSWPTGTSGSGKTLCTVTFASGQGITYTDPTSGAKATCATAGLKFELELEWTKEAGAAPATHTMVARATVGTGTADPTSLTLAGSGTSSRGSFSWTATGTRSIAMTISRVAGNDANVNATRITGATTDIEVSVASRPTVRVRRTGPDAIELTSRLASGDRSLYNGNLLGLASTLAVHADADAW